MRRVQLELLFAVIGAEVVRFAVVLRGARSLFGVDLHSTHRIFNHFFFLLKTDWKVVLTDSGLETIKSQPLAGISATAAGGNGNWFA